MGVHWIVWFFGSVGVFEVGWCPNAQYGLPTLPHWNLNPRQKGSF